MANKGRAVEGKLDTYSFDDQLAWLRDEVAKTQAGGRAVIEAGRRVRMLLSLAESVKTAQTTRFLLAGGRS